VSGFTNDAPLVAAFAKAHRIAVLTGAGVSAESGLSTFRGQGGIWQKFRAEELASMDGFLANPDIVWEWYSYRREVLSKAKPNPAHAALAEWESECEEFTVITQNVDGLHRAAGSMDVVELHGNITISRCLSCDQEMLEQPTRWEGKVPLCSCGGRLRPGVVWFGEMLPEDAIARAIHAAETCDMFISIGTSTVVYPAASLPMIAAEHGAYTVEVNPDETPFSRYANLIMREPAGEAVPRLHELWRKESMARNER
jgi:NAD-dependent deacetylase